MTLERIDDRIALHNGVAMPRLGLGVYLAEDGKEVENAVAAALQAGYRSVDTAAVYGNETGVGNALHKSGVPRQELFITTKVWNSDQGYESTLRAFEESRRRLRLENIDLYLIHWPVEGKYLETWRALEKLYREGDVRAIGVSNFQQHHLETLLASCAVSPLVNQIELHPLLTQEPLRLFCGAQNIRIESWRPLLKGRLDYPLLQELARKHQKTAAQIVIRWHLQHDFIVIPKSVHAERIRENGAVFDFTLSDEEMAAIDGMNANRRFGADPDSFDF